MSRKREHNDGSVPSTSSAKLPRQDDEDDTETLQYLPEIGIIESISMKNFMCHDWLDLKFCQNVNFIIGKNGSGKSAIMTAIVIGLGGKASSTNRGTNAHSFIKNQKSAAEISICLRNRGSESYKPELFGDKITVERKLVVDGAGSYKLKNSKGKIVSTKKEDLNHMLEFFNIQLDNPISLLNQEWSRSYLNSKNPQAKYKFFLKATQLEQLKEDYVLTNQKKEIAKQSLTDKEENLKVMETQVSEYKQRYEHHMSLQGLKDKLKHLKRERIWAQVVCMEKTVEKCEAEISRRRELQTRTQSKLDEANEREKSLKKEYETLKENIKEATYGINALQRELDAAKVAANQAKEEQRKIQQNKNMIRAKLSSLKKEHAELRKKIDDLEKREDMAIQRQMRADEKKEQEEKLAEIEDEIREVDKELQEKRAAVDKCRAEKNKIDQELRHLVDQLNTEKRNLAEMKQGRANHMNRFGQFMPELLNRINAAYGRKVFQKKPIGPIGAYINLRDTSWTLAVETCLRPVLTSFLCDNQTDSRQLEKIMRELIRGRQIPSIIVSRFKESVYDVSQYKADTSMYPTIYDMVKVDDPNVINCLIDSRRIENIMLIADTKEARNVMQKQPPRNCIQTYTANGDQIYPAPNFRYYSCYNNNATLLQNSMEETIQSMETVVGQLQAQVELAKVSCEVAGRSLASEERNSKAIQTRHMKLRENLSQIRMKITEILNSDDGENTDIAVFEEEEGRVRQQITSLEQDLSACDRAAEECELKVRECMANYKSVDARLQEAMGSDGYRDNLVKCGKEVEDATAAVKHFTEKMRFQQSDLNKLVEANAKRDSDLKEVHGKPEILGERFDPEHTVEECDFEITKIEKRLKREAELTGGDRDVMLQRYVESLTTYQESKKHVSQLIKFLKTFDATMRVRDQKFLHFRNSVTTRVQFAFCNMLMCRGYQGSLKIDHDKQTLEISVQTNKSTQGSADVRTLSGGERSFSTVALVVSLWNATESPFRMMDEFDIFMDLVNRQITMTMMIEMAKEQSYRQFIFLTPLNMTSLQANNMIKIHHLKDPDRNQGVLPYQPVNREEEEEEEENP